MEAHCRITGAIARKLLETLPAEIQQSFPPQASLIVMMHDVGKIFPHFQYVIYHNAYEIPPEEAACCKPLNQPPPHATVSYLALATENRIAAEIAGWHHGNPPASVPYTATADILGGTAWQDRRMELVRRLRGSQDWPSACTKEQITLLKGLTAVSDWIGSGDHFDDPEIPWEPLVDRAVEEAGFVPPSFVKGKSFNDIFGFTPNSMQNALADAVTGPGVYVLEAPMGMGKTEAALYAAYRLLAAGKARGIYFALPTQLTSTKIYERLLPFRESILEPGCE